MMILLFFNQFVSKCFLHFVPSKFTLVAIISTASSFITLIKNSHSHSLFNANTFLCHIKVIKHEILHNTMSFSNHFICFIATRDPDFFFECSSIKRQFQLVFKISDWIVFTTICK